MARRRLPVGAHGAINVCETKPGSGRYRARTRVRDTDGLLRVATAFGGSPNEAETELLDRLTRRTPPSHEPVTPETPIRTLAGLWLQDVDERTDERAASTRALYRRVTERIIIQNLGGLLIRDVKTSTVNAFLKTVTAGHGQGTAKTTRACLSLMFQHAATFDAITFNPALLAKSPKRAEPAPMARALEEDEVATLMRKLRRDAAAVGNDTPDLIEFLLGTGCRIGEAMALRTSQLDLDAGAVKINATVTEAGREERTKSEAGQRVLVLPAHIVAMLRRRIADPAIRTDVAVFPSPLGRMRDKSNTTSDLRRTFDRLGFPWVTSHTMRKTVATRLHKAKVPTSEISDQLGHSRVSMTQDHYIGRGVASVAAASILGPP